MAEGPNREAQAAQIIRVLAGTPADRYIDECVIGPLGRTLNCAQNTASVLEAMRHPGRCLRALFAVYMFSRRGKERAELATAACEAWDRLQKKTPMRQFLEEDSGEALWDSFAAIMDARGRAPLEQINRGVIQGLAELAQEAWHEQEGQSIFTWIESSVAASGHVEPCFMRIVDIRGVGPKVCSLFLRDVVLLTGLEGNIEHSERIFVQPIDKWLRMVAHHVVEELSDTDAPDWIIAGKLAKSARRAGVSGIRLNMGASYFGNRMIGSASMFDQEIYNLIPEGPVTSGSQS